MSWPAQHHQQPHKSNGRRALEIAVAVIVAIALINGCMDIVGSGEDDPVPPAAATPATTETTATVETVPSGPTPEERCERLLDEARVGDRPDASGLPCEDDVDEMNRGHRHLDRADDALRDDDDRDRARRIARRVLRRGLDLPRARRIIDRADSRDRADADRARRARARERRRDRARERARTPSVPDVAPAPDLEPEPDMGGGGIPENCSDTSMTDFPTPPGDPTGLDADGDGVACES